jgi:hypothetical protein
LTGLGSDPIKTTLDAQIVADSETAATSRHCHPFGRIETGLKIHFLEVAVEGICFP